MTGIENNKNDVDIEKLATLAATVKDVAFINLVKQIKGGKKLTAHDLVLLNEFEKKASVAQQKNDSKNKINTSEKIFSNTLEVVEYLKNEKWKISKSSIYEHVKDGKLRPDQGEYFTLKNVLNYASTYLKKAYILQKEKSEGLAKKKAENELAIQELNRRLLDLKLAKEEGRSIDKAIVYQQFATILVSVDSAIDGQAMAGADEAAEMIMHSDNKPAAFYELVRDIKDRALNELAKVSSLEVVFGEVEELANLNK